MTVDLTPDQLALLQSILSEHFEQLADEELDAEGMELRAVRCRMEETAALLKVFGA